MEEAILTGFGPVEVVSGLPAVRTVPVELPAIPPRPVFDDDIEALALQVGDGKCASEEDFKRNKGLRTSVSRLNGTIKIGYSEVKQAIDKAKEPVLEAEKDYLKRVEALGDKLDDGARDYVNEQNRLAAIEAARLKAERDEAARKQLEADEAAARKQRDEDAALAAAFGDQEKAKEILEAPLPEPPPPPPERQTPPPTAGLTWAKGQKLAPTLKAKIVNPSKVKAAYCLPDLPTINQKVSSWKKTIKGTPTTEQIAELEKEVGGIRLEWM